MIILRNIEQKEFGVFRSYCLDDESPDGYIRHNIDKTLPNGISTPNNQLLSIVDQKQSVVGVLWYSIIERKDYREAFILDLIIYPQYRRQGYAQSAMRSFEEEIISLGISKLALSVSPTNSEAIDLYHKSNFTSDYVRMTKNVALDIKSQLTK